SKPPCISVSQPAPAAPWSTLGHEGPIGRVRGPVVEALGHLLWIRTKRLLGPDVDNAVLLAPRLDFGRAHPDIAKFRSGFHAASFFASKLANVAPLPARRFNSGAGLQYSPCCRSKSAIRS